MWYTIRFSLETYIRRKNTYSVNVSLFINYTFDKKNNWIISGTRILYKTFLIEELQSWSVDCAIKLILHFSRVRFFDCEKPQTGIGHIQMLQNRLLNAS